MTMSQGQIPLWKELFSPFFENRTVDASEIPNNHMDV